MIKVFWVVFFFFTEIEFLQGLFYLPRNDMPAMYHFYSQFSPVNQEIDTYIIVLPALC